QFGTVEQFHRGEERIHVHVQDRGRRVVTAPVPVHRGAARSPAHRCILGIAPEAVIAAVMRPSGSGTVRRGPPRAPVRGNRWRRRPRSQPPPPSARWAGRTRSPHVLRPAGRNASTNSATLRWLGVHRWPQVARDPAASRVPAVPREPRRAVPRHYARDGGRDPPSSAPPPPPRRPPHAELPYGRAGRPTQVGDPQ